MRYIVHEDHFVIIDDDIVAPTHSPETPNFEVKDGRTIGCLPWAFKQYDVNIDAIVPNITDGALHYVARNNINRLMLAIHEAYDKHMSVDLRIDDFWMLICYGWMTHIKSNPEQFRSRFVEHSGVLNVRTNASNFILCSPTNNWSPVVEQFNSALYGNLTDMMYNYIMCNYMSRCTHTTNVNTIALMNLLDSYFQYHVDTNCGIRAIVIRGTRSDWTKLMLRVKDLSKYGLEWWSKPMLKVIETVVSTFDANRMSFGARHQLDDFWRKMYGYKPNSHKNVVGWINVFFPWILNNSNLVSPQIYIRNPMVWHWQAAIALDQPGNNLDRFPLCISVVPAIHNCDGAQNVEFISGFLATTMNIASDDLLPGISIRKILKPQIGYGVRRPIE